MNLPKFLARLFASEPFDAPAAPEPRKLLFHPDAYPSKVVEGVITTDMCDVFAWRIAQRKKLASFITSTAGFSACHSCGLPWFVVEGHVIDYSDTGGCFAICESCWKDLGAYGAWPFYDALIRENHPEHPEYVDVLRRHCFRSEGPVRIVRSHLET